MSPRLIEPEEDDDDMGSLMGSIMGSGNVSDDAFSVEKVVVEEEPTSSRGDGSNLQKNNVGSHNNNNNNNEEEVILRVPQTTWKKHRVAAMLVIVILSSYSAGDRFGLPCSFWAAGHGDPIMERCTTTGGRVGVRVMDEEHQQQENNRVKPILTNEKETEQGAEDDLGVGAVTNVTPPDSSYLKPIPKLLMEDLLQGDDPTAVASALSSLVDMCHDDGKAGGEENSLIALYELGAHVAVVAAMRKWYGDPTVQSNGLKFIGSFIIEWEKDIGVLETILLAMKNFPRDVDVQMGACAALSAMSWRKATAVRLVRELDGADVVVEAMKNFPKNGPLQLLACSIFFRASKWQELRAYISDSGGLASLAAAIENFANNEFEDSNKVYEAARGAMERLVSST